jgi:resuscitation-promoting factor RpfB
MGPGKGKAFTIMAVGGLLGYSALTGKGFLSATRSLLHGQKPDTQDNPISGVSSAGDGGTTVSGGHGSNSQNRALGQRMAAAVGWTGSQWNCLDQLWEHESGWDDKAANPSSNARGIPQNIQGWSANYQEGNAAQQIAWGIQYIQGRYGDPCSAWSFWQSHSPHWY